MAMLQSTADRVGSVYDVLLPDLAAKYADGLGGTDPLLDQPTIRIVERLSRDLARLPHERRELLADVTIPAGDAARLAKLRHGLSAAGANFVDFRPAKETKS
jgi:hypothetical protein